MLKDVKEIKIQYLLFILHRLEKNYYNIIIYEIR